MSRDIGNGVVVTREIIGNLFSKFAAQHGIDVRMRWLWKVGLLGHCMSFTFHSLAKIRIRGAEGKDIEVKLSFEDRSGFKKGQINEHRIEGAPRRGTFRLIDHECNCQRHSESLGCVSDSARHSLCNCYDTAILLLTSPSLVRKGDRRSNMS